MYLAAFKTHIVAELPLIVNWLYILGIHNEKQKQNEK